MSSLTAVHPLVHASSDAELIIADDHYLALDLVLNAAGEGLILAFFHAIVGQSRLSWVVHHLLVSHADGSIFCA